MTATFNEQSDPSLSGKASMQHPIKMWKIETGTFANGAKKNQRHVIGCRRHSWSGLKRFTKPVKLAVLGFEEGAASAFNKPTGKSLIKKKAKQRQHGGRALGRVKRPKVDKTELGSNLISLGEKSGKKYMKQEPQ